MGFRGEAPVIKWKVISFVNAESKYKYSKLLISTFSNVEIVLRIYLCLMVMKGILQNSTFKEYTQINNGTRTTKQVSSHDNWKWLSNDKNTDEQGNPAPRKQQYLPTCTKGASQSSLMTVWDLLKEWDLKSCTCIYFTQIFIQGHDKKSVFVVCFSESISVQFLYYIGKVILVKEQQWYYLTYS